MKHLLAGLLATFAIAPFGVAHAELQEQNFRALLHHTPVPQSKDVEVPFWTETIPQASGGKVTAAMTFTDQAGLADADLLRYLKIGAFDFASFDLSKMAGDDPRFEGCDIAGLTSDLESARAACDAYRPVLARMLEEQWNAKLLAIGTAPPQAVWCRTEINGLADLEGKKIRVFNRTMNDFVKAVGAIPINISFAEVLPALQQGVVDCGVTGNAVGNAAGWTEVTSTILPLALGWSINIHAVNLDAWNRLDAETQAFFEAQFPVLEERFWTFFAEAVADADNCNFGREPCRMGNPANMTLAPFSDEDRQRYAEILENVVISGWAERVGPAAAAEWNDTVGKALGLTAPTE